MAVVYLHYRVPQRSAGQVVWSSAATELRAAKVISLTLAVAQTKRVGTAIQFKQIRQDISWHLTNISS